MSDSTDSLKSIVNDRFLKNFSWQFLFFDRNLLRGSRLRNLFTVLFFFEFLRKISLHNLVEVFKFIVLTL